MESDMDIGDMGRGRKRSGVRGGGDVPPGERSPFGGLVGRRPPVSTKFMSSPEHWKTSMYRCFLKYIM
jgi:hypothetical protein